MKLAPLILVHNFRLSTTGVRGYFVFALVVALSGCATTDRYLTEEQDREMRATCVDGCMVVAGKAWQQLRQAVKMCGLGDI